MENSDRDLNDLIARLGSATGNQILITLLEKEMEDDVSKINYDSQNEGQLSLENIKQWYVEAEKVIRVLSNVLAHPMNQAINQLRYAGHHILKSQTADNPTSAQNNLVEAFKHCKRSVYDAMDFYVYNLYEKYRVLPPWLDLEKTIQEKLDEYAKKIAKERQIAAERIDYYQQIWVQLIDGLKLIEELNKYQRESGLTNKVLARNKDLETKNETLRDENKALETKLGTRFAWFVFVIGILLALGTPIGLVFLDWHIKTEKHDVNATLTIHPYKPETESKPSTMPMNDGKRQVPNP